MTDRRRRQADSAPVGAAMPCSPELPESQFRIGKGLVGQCAKEKTAHPALRRSAKVHARHARRWARLARRAWWCCRCSSKDETKAVIELASLHPFTDAHLSFLEQLTQSIGVVLNTIEATMRTEGLLQQSQQLTVELQAGQKELQQTNEELEQRPGSSPIRTRKSSARTWKSSRPAAPWKKRPPSLPHFQIQVGVPGEHVARTAHAAQLRCSFSGSNSRRTTGAISTQSRSSLPATFIRRLRPVQPDQRHSRSLQRSNLARSRLRPKISFSSLRSPWTWFSAYRRKQKSAILTADPACRIFTDDASACSKSSKTCSRAVSQVHHWAKWR